MPQNCKCCTSSNREFIEQELQNGTRARVIAEELERRGETVSQQNISNHKRNHWTRNDPYSDALEQITRELEQQMRMSTPTLAAAYLVLLRQLDALKHVKVTPDTIVKTAEAITRLGGLKTQNEMLLAYANKAFSPERVAENQRIAENQRRLRAVQDSEGA